MNAYETPTSKVLPPRSTRFVVATSEGRVYLRMNEVEHLWAEGGYTTVHCTNGTRYLVCKHLGAMEKDLPNDHFFRCHHTHLINLTKVVKTFRTDGMRVQMENGKMISVSRRRWSALAMALERLL